MSIVEYRWKIKYPDDRKSQAVPWLVCKKKAVKKCFQCLCNDPELVSTLTTDLKETVYLDKRIQKKDKDHLTSRLIGSDSPFQYQKYQLFRWKVKCVGGVPKEKRPREGE